MEQAGHLQVSHLKRLVVSLQQAGDKREQSERNLRQKLEKEIDYLRSGAKEVSSFVYILHCTISVCFCFIFFQYCV